MLGFCLQDALRGEFNLDGLIVPVDKYAPQNTFYLKLLRQSGVNVADKKWDQLTPGDRVWVTDHGRKHKMDPQYTYTHIEDVGKAKIYEITGNRQSVLGG